MIDPSRSMIHDQKKKLKEFIRNPESNHCPRSRARQAGVYLAPNNNITMTPPSSSSTASSPWMYFVAGSLLPTLAWLLMTRSSRNASATLLIKDHPLSLQEEEDDDNDEGDFDDGDDQMAAATSSGSRPSSQWGIRDAPYKVTYMETKSDYTRHLVY